MRIPAPGLRARIGASARAFYLRYLHDKLAVGRGLIRRLATRQRHLDIAALAAAFNATPRVAWQTRQLPDARLPKAAGSNKSAAVRWRRHVVDLHSRGNVLEKWAVADAYRAEHTHTYRGERTLCIPRRRATLGHLGSGRTALDEHVGNVAICWCGPL